MTAAAKVRTPPRQTSTTILEAKVFAGGRKPVTFDAATNGRVANTRPARLRFRVRLVTTNGTMNGADTLTELVCVRSGRRDGWRHEPTDIE
jgi:hypothetical protein